MSIIGTLAAVATIEEILDKVKKKKKNKLDYNDKKNLR